MKIFQFTPNLTNQVPEKKSPAAGGSRSSPDGPDFASLLQAAAARPTARTGEPGQVISLENQRASRLPPLSDLGEAGSLLGRLNQAILASSPETLRGVHNLEGLVYVYPKTPF